MGGTAWGAAVTAPAPGSPGKPRRSHVPMWGAVLTLGLMLAAALLLAGAGWDTQSIIGLLAAVAATAGSAQLALVKVATVDERAQHIDRRTATIERQTNGEMTATIHAAVGDAMAKHAAQIAAPVKKAARRSAK